MKRSDVIEKIKRLYNLEIHNYPKCNGPEIFAENLLSHLEQDGMLPPPKNGKVVLEEKNGELFIPLFGWEDEA